LGRTSNSEPMVNCFGNYGLILQRWSNQSKKFRQLCTNAGRSLWVDRLTILSHKKMMVESVEKVSAVMYRRSRSFGRTFKQFRSSHKYMLENNLSLLSRHWPCHVSSALSFLSLTCACSSRAVRIGARSASATLIRFESMALSFHCGA
jgi:hypothetical protein